MFRNRQIHKESISSLQLLGHVQLFVTLWSVACQASLSITNSQSLFKLMPLSWWCHSIISSSVVPFSPCFHSFPASESFPVSQLFTSGGQSKGASASASGSVLPVNIRDWFPLGLTDLISLQPKGLSSIFSNTTVQKHQFFSIDSFISPVFLSDFPLIFCCSVLDAYTLDCYILLENWPFIVLQCPSLR